MARPALLLLLLAFAGTPPAGADTVYLKNGRAYEGVLAERTPQGVRVQLAFGVLVIPHHQVLAVEAAPSALAGYLSRKAALQARLDAPAAAWLELARWAKANDLATSSREAALLAADLDPRLPGLDALLRPLGLVFEEALASWIPFEEAMARRGLVRYEGEWMSKAEQRDRIAERDRRRAVAAQEAASRRLADAAEAMRRGEERMLERELRRREAELRTGWLPVATFPGFWLPPPVVIVVKPPGQHPSPPPATAGPRRGYGRLQSRQPGSFLPLPGDPIVPPELITPPAPGTMSAHSSGG